MTVVKREEAHPGDKDRSLQDREPEGWNPGKVQDAYRCLARGGVIIYPTETVYGIGARYLDLPAIERIFRLKGRSNRAPISLAVSSFAMLQQVAEVDSLEMQLARRLLPGPVTLLLRKLSHIPSCLTAGSDTLGVRYPEHSLALKIIELSGPITSTSANLSGQPPPTSAEKIDVQLAKAVDLVVDGGPCLYSQPSTLVNLREGTVVREGAGLNRVRAVLEK